MIAGVLVLASTLAYPFGDDWGKIKLAFTKLKWSILPKTSEAVDLGSSTKKFGELHVVDAYIDHIAGDTGLETLTAGDFITNSGTVKNPVLDVDVDDSADTITELWSSGKTSDELDLKIDIADSTAWQLVTDKVNADSGIWDAAAAEVNADSGVWEDKYTKAEADLLLDDKLDIADSVVISDIAYNDTTWDSNTDGASKNAIRDKINPMDTAIGLNTDKTTNQTHTGEVTGSIGLVLDPTCISGKADTTVVDADYFLFWDATDSALKKVDAAELTAAVGGGAKWRFVNIPAGSWDYPDTNIAPLDTDTGTNGTIKRQLFDDTTEEFLKAVIQMPSDLDAADTVFFEAYGYAETAVADSYIELTLYHSAKTDGESWDAAYSSKISGDLSTDGTQDQLDYFSWSETVSTLSWAANDQIRIKLSRSAPSANNLSGDWGLTHFRIKLPRE